MSNRTKIILAFVFAALIFIAIVVGHAHRLATGSDRGFMDRPCVTGQPAHDELHWMAADFPIHVVYESDVAEWVPAIEAAMGRWNLAARRVLFVVDAHPLEPLYEPTTLHDPVIIVQRTNADGKATDDFAPVYEPGQMPAHLLWDKDCHLRRVELRLPGLAAQEKWGFIAEHEFGHALGFDHDESEASIMYPNILRWTTGTILDGDAMRLRTLK